MSSQQAQTPAPTVRARQDAARRSRPIAWLPLILVFVVGATYGLFLVLPYYVNDLDQLPLDEVASGAHDPKDLWPYRDGGALSVIWTFGALFAFMLGPFILLAAPLWAAVLMWRDRRTLRVREWCALAMATLCGVALIAELASPFHDALVNWWLD
jgi:hypothetical protein